MSFAVTQHISRQICNQYMTFAQQAQFAVSYYLTAKCRRTGYTRNVCGPMWHYIRMIHYKLRGSE